MSAQKVTLVKASWLDILKFIATIIAVAFLGLLLLIIFPLFIISLVFIIARMGITGLKYMRAKISGKAPSFSEVEVVAPKEP